MNIFDPDFLSDANISNVFARLRLVRIMHKVQKDIYKADCKIKRVASKYPLDEELLNRWEELVRDMEDFAVEIPERVVARSRSKHRDRPE